MTKLRLRHIWREPSTKASASQWFMAPAEEAAQIKRELSTPRLLQTFVKLRLAARALHLAFRTSGFSGAKIPPVKTYCSRWQAGGMELRLKKWCAWSV